MSEKDNLITIDNEKVSQEAEAPFTDETTTQEPIIDNNSSESPQEKETPEALEEVEPQKNPEEQPEPDEHKSVNHALLNHNRWELAKKLAIEYSLVPIPLYAVDDEQGLAKVPRIKDWQRKTQTTIEELEKWEKQDRYSNIGLVTGGKNGILGIDVDGDEGYEILLELSKGDLPDTVTYTTPNKGMRLLYKPREETKDRIFKKYTKKGKGKHAECSLLGDGQQTVLPYSIHSNGGVYEFVEGKSFDDIEIADTPVWMEELMLKNSHKTLDGFKPIEDTSGNFEQPSTNASTIEAEITLEDIFSKCRKLQELLETQKTAGLDEDTWFNTVSLLINSGHVDLARKFSALSNKHDARSEKRIDELALNVIRATTRCMGLGCSEDNVLECFGSHNKNSSGEITNSPGKLIRLEQVQRQKIGLSYGNKGNLIINGNIFVRHILKNYHLATKDGAVFYNYANNFWSRITEHKLKRMLRSFFNSIVEDNWTTDIEDVYFGNLVLECPDVDSMEAGHNYINVQNGLFNIETMTLEPHKKDIFSTVQLPIAYDPDAKCPLFIKYLNDVFENDIDLIKHIQEIMGYCLVRSAKAQKIFIFLGEGSNGKSVLCLLLVALCGKENVSSVTLRGLSGRFAKAGLVDKNVNISTENELAGEKMNTEDIKAISAGDPVQIERKHENSYSESLFTKLIFAANRMPFLKDNSYALMRRLDIIPFNRTFVDNPTNPNQGKSDKELVDKLMEELAGILNFAIEGLKRLQQNNYEFTASKKSLEILEEYKLEINPYLDFVQTAIEKAEGKSQKKMDSKTLYAGFMEWCNQANRKQLSNTTTRRFMKEIRFALKSLNIDFSESDSNGKHYFEGSKMTDEYEQLTKRAVRNSATRG